MRQFFDGLSPLANAAQLTGVDMFRIIEVIVKVSETARDYKDDCHQLAKQAQLVSSLVRPLTESVVLMQSQVVVSMLRGLDETLQRSFMLVDSCQEERSYLRRFLFPNNKAAQFRQLQGQIGMYLQVFPIISLCLQLQLPLDLPEAEGGPQESSENPSNPAET